MTYNAANTLNETCIYAKTTANIADTAIIQMVSVVVTKKFYHIVVNLKKSSILKRF